MKYFLPFLVLVLPQISFAALSKPICDFGYPKEFYERKQVIADVTGRCSSGLRLEIQNSIQPCLNSSKDLSPGLFVAICGYHTPDLFEAIASVPTDINVSKSTGAVFKRDTSLPQLGEAWRDPSGLVWGSKHEEISSLGNYIDNFSWQEATDYCKKIGARLPTIKEIKSLQNYLGIDSPRGYSLEGLQFSPYGDELPVLKTHRPDRILLSDVGSTDGAVVLYKFDLITNSLVEMTGYPVSWRLGQIRCVVQR